MSRYAAIDVGTNSVVLLVAERQTDRRFSAVLERMDITRLGQGVDRTNTLAAEAMENTLKVLERYAAEARELGAKQIVVSATSAARDASNGHLFIAAAKERAGLDIEIIPGDEEARLSWAAVYADFGGRSPLVVLDIGGGSTEFIFGSATGEISFRHSFDVGAVRLTERHIHTDPPTTAELDTIDAELEKSLVPVKRAAPGTVLVSVGGTATTLAAVVHHVTPYDSALIHGSKLTLAQVEASLTRLASLPTHLRKTVPGLDAKRADVIVSGVLVLRAAMRAVGVEELTVSDHGLRWGLLADRFANAP